MPIHDWTRVDAGIFHAFHHGWISRFTHALNRELLPNDHYAMAELVSGKFGPEMPRFDRPENDLGGFSKDDASESGGVLTLPKLKPIAETHLGFYRRKQNAIAIRHVSDDGLVAMIEIVSPGNKTGRKPLRAFVEKAADLLDQGIHLLIIDLFPPGKFNPQGIHGEIWLEIDGTDYVAPEDKPLTLAAYENGTILRAYVVHAAVGDALGDMPLFLEAEKAVSVPLEEIYNATFAEQPRRWRRVLETNE
jgi:Protein of unknown function (DUF4058)